MPLLRARISAPPLHTRIRHYRNLRRMPRLLHEVFSAYQFTSVAQHLGLLAEPLPRADEPNAALSQRAPSAGVPPSLDSSGAAGGFSPKGVSVVVPCYNEIQSLGYLSKTLGSLTETFRKEYRFTFLFVDDCSTDATWTTLEELFSGRPEFVLLRHERNQGVAAAIQPGIRHAPDDIVCSIDCDCTYDPHELGEMIPLLEEGVALVTSSPYHPAGLVRNVPAWRLFLSKGLSRLYRIVLRQKLFTYTSCFRVYRRSAVAGLALRTPGYLGLTELVARLDLADHRVVEHPSTLEVRVLGVSKMKVIRNIIGHLRLLAGLLHQRLFRRNTRIVVESSL